MEDNSICSLVPHLNVPKFLAHIRDGCLMKTACRCSPATDVSDNRVTHYQSPTFINASNLFSRCIGGCRIPVFTSLVIAVSGVREIQQQYEILMTI